MFARFRESHNEISYDFRDTYDSERNSSSAREFPDENRASELTPVKPSSAQARISQGFRCPAHLGHAVEEQHHIVHLHTDHISVLLSSCFFQGFADKSPNYAVHLLHPR